MENKFRIVETEEYTLAVFDKEVKAGDKSLLMVEGFAPMILTHFEPVEEGYEGKKIIGYQPKGNAPELDLPLLPDVEDDGGEKVLNEDFNVFQRLFNITKTTFSVIWKSGYKSATKKYSEEDLRKAIELALREFVKDYQMGNPLNITEYQNKVIQSLEQPKTPKWFVVETVCDQCLDDETVDSCYCNFGNYKTVLKTTTINNKTYLVGTYLN